MSWHPPSRAKHWGAVESDGSDALFDVDSDGNSNLVDPLNDAGMLYERWLKHLQETMNGIVEEEKEEVETDHEPDSDSDTQPKNIFEVDSPDTNEGKESLFEQKMKRLKPINVTDWPSKFLQIPDLSPG